MKIWKLLACTVILLAVAAARGDIVGGPFVSPVNGHTYYMLSQNTWTASEVEAISLGGHLATVRSEAENSWIYSTFGAVGRNLWIGINDAPFEGQFNWISGEPVVYTKWSPGEPSSGAQDFGDIYASNLPFWDNFSNASQDNINRPFNGVAEVLPGPRPRQLIFKITGFIDSSDYLSIHGSTLQWHHTDGGAAVGRHAGNNYPTTITEILDNQTIMDAVEWTPTWPLDVPAEIRFDAYSSVFDDVATAMPTSEIVEVSAVGYSGRGAAIVIQQPSLANDYETIIRINDGFNGSAFTSAQITVSFVPEPRSYLLAIALVLFLTNNRQRKQVSCAAIE